MKYVVRVADPVTGEMCVKSKPTTKTHAKKWASQYAKEGLQADIAPVGEVVLETGKEIESAFKAEAEHRWDFVKVRFSWINAEEKPTSTYLSMRDLYMDWNGECEHCPENDTVIFDICVGTNAIPNEPVEGFRFEELMQLIGKTWLSKKRGRPSKM